MVKKIQKFYSSLLARKWRFAILILFVFILGRELPIFTLGIDANLSKEFAGQSLLGAMASVSGMQLSSLTVFSLGLSPWMSSIIVWRVVGLLKVFRLDRMTEKQSTFYQTILMFVIALIQAIALTGSAEFVTVGGFSQLFYRLFTIVLLVTGTYVLTWMGSLNSEYGLGGYIIIMLVNLILAMINLLMTYFYLLSSSIGKLIAATVVFVIISGIIIFFTIMMYRGQYRIPLRSVSIHSEFMEETYLPIAVNPAGGMPAMYGMTLMTLPPLFFSTLSSFFPQNGILKYLATNVTTSTYLGVCIYIIVLWALTIGFAYINMDPEDLAFNLRKNGNYIDGVYPGLETEKYLRKRISFFAKIGAIFICLVCGFPLFIAVAYPAYSGVSTLFSYVFIISSLMFTIIEQVLILRIAKQYDDVLD